MEAFTLILGFVLSIVCWWIYHSFFSVYYVGGLGKGCLSEIIGCLLVGFILAIFLTSAISLGFQAIWQHKFIVAGVVIVVILIVSSVKK